MALDTRSLDYKPIHLDKRELRLLEIQTGRDVNDPVISRMSNVRVTADLEFVGLCALLRDSEENSTEDLWVNACKVSVPTNIGQALRHLRSLFLRDKTALYPASAANTFSPAPPRPQPRAKKQPGWLKHLVRGFRDILPDEPGQSSRSTPLRVWLDCLCINLRNPDEAEQRRAHLSLAYESARTTLGWLGPKDPTSDGALRVFKQLDNLFPPNFGDPQDRIDHPENYSPRMTWLAPVGPAWEEDAKVNGNPEDGPQYIAVKNFLNRPFFKRQWILEELTLARCPGFLLGDELVSYKEILHWNQIDMEFEKAGCEVLPKKVCQTIKDMPKIDIGVVFTLLDDYERRRHQSNPQDLLTTTNSTFSTSSFPDFKAPTRPETSRTTEDK